VSAEAGGEGMSQEVCSKKTEEVGGKSVQLCSSSSGLVVKDMLATHSGSTHNNRKDNNTSFVLQLPLLLLFFNNRTKDDTTKDHLDGTLLFSIYSYSFCSSEKNKRLFR
jgi:hypothetical protein